jgi:hypothetical protein
MKPKGLLIAVVLLAILAGLTWWSNKKEAEKSKTSGDSTTVKLLTIPDDQLQQIKIKRANGDVLTLQREKSKWLVTEPAPERTDQDVAGQLAAALANLTADKVVEDKPGDLKAYGLAAPALDVEVTRKDGKSSHLLIGDDTLNGAGVYAKLANEARVVTLATSAKTSIDKQPEDLRDKRILKFDADTLSRVELTASGPTIEFGKNGQSEWQIVKPRPLRADGSAVDALVTKLKEARMQISVGDDPAKQFAAAPKLATVKLTDAVATETLDVRRNKELEVYVKSSAFDRAYHVNSDIGVAVDKTLADFRNKKLFDFGFSDPSKVELKGAAYTKNGDKWTNGPKTMDNSSVQNLIDKLRDLAASGFPEKGGGEPVFEATVTSNNGKRVEKVVVSKLGTQYFAQREGEPSIYELDAKAVEDVQKAAADVKVAAPEAPKKK